MDKKPKIPKKTKEVKLVPKDLQDQMGAIEAIATAFNCLDKGMFPHSYLQAVRMSAQFLAKLHEQTVSKALEHPQAHMIEELKVAKKALKEKQTEKVEDGQEAAAI